MLRGQFEHAVDAKGRTSLPARYRDALEATGSSRLILTRGLYGSCLDVFPLKQWEELEAKVAELPSFDPNVVKLRRLYISAAVECDLDKQGRVLIPPTLRDFAAIDKNVVWVGMTTKAELWSSEHWLRETENASSDMSFLKELHAQGIKL
jgi:MraZ protein